jgi:heat shock protein HslJ
MSLNASPLDHTKWKLIENSPGLKLNESRPATIAFEGDQISLRACNNMGGRYQIDDQKITVPGPMRSTMMACMPDAQALDTALSKLLGGGVTYHVEGDQLTLTGADGSIWTFLSVKIASKDAITKFIYVAPTTKECTAGAGKMDCLQIRDTKDEPWRLYYSTIIGFTPVPGIEYRLRIKEDKVANPPADSSSVVWYLDLVVEQKVVAKN